MTTRIVAAILDKQRLTLYKPDGATVIIPQGDPRVRTIMETAPQAIIANGWADVDLDNTPTGFHEFEKQSGVVRFFKVARSKLAGLFSGKSDSQAESAVIGKVPPPAPLIEDDLTARTKAVVQEILDHAQPVTDPTFTMEGVNTQADIVEEDGNTPNKDEREASSHTIVAHVEGKLVPNMERIESHLARAARLGSTVGAENFLRRLAAVIDKRTHSIEDLLVFMERADTPIADDGSIIIYKVLNRLNGHYVDCHTGKVPQKVGSYVCMDIKLVDRNRKNECSDGLHVARRGYISSFSGDVCVVAKLAPEDVVTVPAYDANKMRVMGYHILAELPQELFALLRRNRPITELEDGKLLLGQVLAGHHPPRIEEVRITEKKGGGVIVTPITQPVSVAAPVKEAAPAEALENPKKEKADKPVDPKAVVKKVAALSRKDQAQKLWKAYQKKPTKKNLDKLVAYKQSVRLGWGKLGIDPAELGEELEKHNQGA